ncbi:MAG: response regulator [Lachnospiraceae bacterium]|nr:response regulator [Lachnospiraceae bacterium]
MEKDIYLVALNQNFMVNAIIKNITEAGYKASFHKPGVTELGRMEEKPHIFLLYLEGIQEEMNDLFVYLKDYIDEEGSGILLYLVGNPEELEKAHAIMPAEFVTHEFERPLNVKLLSGQIDVDVDKGGLVQEKKSILVVDDDSTMLRTLKMFLSDKYQVYMANSGMNAIALLAKKKIDLILLDYEMPVLNGPKVLEMIRSESEYKDTPVMFLTGRDDKESVMSVINLKPEKYLLKSLPADELMKTINDFFEMQKAK